MLETIVNGSNRYITFLNSSVNEMESDTGMNRNI
jgi:hypothetical protein